MLVYSIGRRVSGVGRLNSVSVLNRSEGFGCWEAKQC